MKTGSVAKTTSVAMLMAIESESAQTSILDMLTAVELGNGQICLDRVALGCFAQGVVPCCLYGDALEDEGQDAGDGKEDEEDCLVRHLAQVILYIRRG